MAPAARLGPSQSRGGAPLATQAQQGAGLARQGAARGDRGGGAVADRRGRRGRGEDGRPSSWQWRGSVAWRGSGRHGSGCGPGRCRRCGFNSRAGPAPRGGRCRRCKGGGEGVTRQAWRHHQAAAPAPFRCALAASPARQRRATQTGNTLCLLFASRCCFIRGPSRQSATTGRAPRRERARRARSRRGGGSARSWRDQNGCPRQRKARAPQLQRLLLNGCGQANRVLSRFERSIFPWLFYVFLTFLLY